MKNQEYTTYAHYFNIEPEESQPTTEIEFVNINGQLVPIIADVR